MTQKHTVLSPSCGRQEHGLCPWSSAQMCACPCHTKQSPAERQGLYDAHKYDYLQDEPKKERRTRGAVPQRQRSYVAITYTELLSYTKKPDYWLLIVGKPGEKKVNVERRAKEMLLGWGDLREKATANLVVVSNSVWKRSYHSTYSEWLDNYYRR